MDIDRLTAKEKLRLICGKDFWHTEDFGGKLPQLTVADGPVGLRVVRARAADGTETAYPATAYPSIQLLANTWDRDCANKMGAALADDCLERDVDILLAPGVNVKRTPLCGRNFEYFSEDPLLAGEMAKAYISGLQEGGAGACLKHFCCNNLEYDRLHQSSDVDERTLREIYYLPFEIACEAKPVSVMCSYNRINGTYGAEYKKGFTVLREEFGFDGAIFSDWSAVRDRAASARAGLDLEMPFSEENYQKLCKDFEEGSISEKEIDACAARVLALISRCKTMRQGKTPRCTEAERRRIAQEIAAEGMVLLKNDGTLPLAAGARLAVAGCYAQPSDMGMLRGAGAAAVNREGERFSVPAALAKRGYAVAFEPAFSYDGIDSFHQDARRAAELAAGSDISVLCVGLGEKFERESADRETLRLPRVQERAILASAAVAPTVVVVFAGAAVDMRAWADKVSAILFAGYPGAGGDEALASLLSGEKNPCGRLSESFPLSLADCPAAREEDVSVGVTRYAEGPDVGYRYYLTHHVPVLFAFGHGLSYSAFAYRNLTAEAGEEGVSLSFDVCNTSGRAGKEVVQVYVRACTPVVYRPARELKAFEKLFVEGGGRQKVSFTLGRRAFAHWSAAEDGWCISDGVYEILVGASSEDIRLTLKVRAERGSFTLLPLQDGAECDRIDV